VGERGALAGPGGPPGGFRVPVGQFRVDIQQFPCGEDVGPHRVGQVLRETFQFRTHAGWQHRLIEVIGCRGFVLRRGRSRFRHALFPFVAGVFSPEVSPSFPGIAPVAASFPEVTPLTTVIPGVPRNP